MGIFERFLTVWVALGIAAGVGLGLWLPSVFELVASLEYAQVNLVVAVFIWVMIYPMMIQIDWSAVKDVGKKPQGLLLTLVVNWLVKPFTMALLAVLFFDHVFAPWIAPQDAQQGQAAGYDGEFALAARLNELVALLAADAQRYHDMCLHGTASGKASKTAKGVADIVTRHASVLRVAFDDATGDDSFDRRARHARMS